MKRFVSLLIFWAASGIVLAQSMQTDSPDTLSAPVVGVAKVSMAQNQISKRYTGQIVSLSVVRIVSRCSGEIQEIGFCDGDFVKKGQILYKIDPVQYESVAQNALARVADCKAKLQYADNCYERANKLFQDKAVSLETVEDRKSALDSASAALMSAEAELTAAKDNLSKTVIIAPDNGLAGVTNFTCGNYITQDSGTLVSIVQTQPIRVRFSISAADYLSLFGSPKTLKQKGIVTIRLADGTDYSEKGKIELLNNEINSKTDSIQVFARFENQDLKLISGGIVSVTLTRQSEDQAIAIPLSALVHDENGSFVFVIDKKNKAEKRYVQAGMIAGTRQIVTKGLQVGEIVADKGTHKITSGSFVTIQE